MNRMMKIGALLLGFGALTACGEYVEIPNAHVGVIKTAVGIKPDVIPTSTLRLDAWCVTCDTIILVETADMAQKEELEIYMPKDRLNLSVEVRGTFSVSPDANDVNLIVSRISPEVINDRVNIIHAQTVYDIYGQQLIRDRARAILAEYTIAEILSNREAIGIELETKLRESFKDRPIDIVNFGLSNIQPPEVIVTAEENRKKREVEIAQAEADKLVKLTQASAALEVAQLQQAVDLKEAETQVLVEQKLREGYSPAYVAMRGLKVLEQLAASDNNLVFLPTEALTNPAMMIGAMSKTLNDGRIIE